MFKKFISFLLILAMLICSSLFAVSVGAVDMYAKEKSDSYKKFIKEMEVNKSFRQTIIAAEELGVEFVDIQNLNFSEKQMNNLIKFDSEKEFLAFIENMQFQNNFVISESDILSRYESKAIDSSATATSYTTVSAWAPGPTGTLVWKNISLQYTLDYRNGIKDLSDVSIIDSFYSGLSFALTRTHQYGSFSGVAVFNNTAGVLTVPFGTANATGLDLYGVEVMGLPIGLQLQSTFNIEFRP